MPRTFLLTLSLLITISPVSLFSQSPGLIVRPVLGSGMTALNPNGDSYASSSTAGFTTDDIAQSELPFKVVPAVAIEPTGDLSTGPSGGFTDIVTKVDGSGFYLHKDANNIYFRLRIGGIISGSKGYSVLIDTDGRMGASGVMADPNFVAPSGNSPGNPGFEYEVVLQTNFQVAVYAIDGTTTPGISASYPLSTHSQISVALSSDGNNPDYLYDWFVPLSSIGNPSSIRTATTTVTSPNSALQGTRSDIYGIDDAAFASPAAAWATVVNAQPAINLSTFTGVENTCTAAPFITAPITPGSTVNVSGTWTRLDASKPSTTTISLYKNGVLIGSTTTNTGATWTIAAGTVVNGDAFYAMAQSTAESQCLRSATLIASSCTVLPATPVLSCGSLKGISGSIPSGSTVSVYLVPTTNASPSSNLVSTGANITYPTATSFAYYVSGCSGGTNNVATGVYMVVTQSGSCVSEATFICISSGSSGAPPPLTSNAISISQPLYAQTTSITGSGVVSGDILRLYINGKHHSSITATGTSFSFSGLTLNTNDKLRIYSQTGTSCMTQSAIFNVSCYTAAPVINTNTTNNLVTGATNIGGTSSHPGASVQLYKGTAPSGVPVGTAVTVAASGSWSTSVPALVANETYYAIQTISGCASSASGSASVLAPAPCPSITGTYTDVSTTVNGTMPLVFTGTIRLYIDGSLIGSQSITSASSWSIALPAYSLYYNGTITAKAISTGTTESTGCSSSIINCTSPSTPTITPVSSTILPGQTVTYSVSNVSAGSWYALLDGNGSSFATSSYRPATGNFSLTTNTFANLGNYNLALSADMLSGCPSATTSALVMVTATLPLTLIDFKGKLEENKVKLNWSTTSEVNLSHFQVQQSVDGVMFEELGTVSAKNISSGLNKYLFNTIEQITSPYFFRLKMIDLDGSYQLSPAILLKPVIKLPVDVLVYPNPFIKVVYAKITTSRAGEFIIRMTDIQGQPVVNRSIQLLKGTNTIKLEPANHLPPGTYLLSLFESNGTLTQVLKLEKSQ